MTKIERALSVTKVENVKYATLRYNRVYFGNEFCERLIPRSDEGPVTVASIYAGYRDIYFRP